MSLLITYTNRLKVWVKRPDRSLIDIVTQAKDLCGADRVHSAGRDATARGWRRLTIRCML
jgi:hypothetical protein